MALDLGLPRRPYLEFYLNSEWHNLIDDVRQTQPIKIERNRKNEQASATPSELNFWLDDSADFGNGDYSPRNPNGQWYPYFGRNVPVRYGFELADDDFNRSSSSGWVGDWINGDSSGGVIANTDWTVASGTARHIVPNQNQWRGSYYNATGAVLRNAEQRVTVTRPALNVTGGIYGVSVQFRVQDTDNYAYAWITIDASENLSVGALQVINGVGFILNNGTDTVVFAGTGQTTEIRAQIDGDTIRVKAWPSTVDEPLDWQLVATGVTINTAGQLGLISYVDSLNTNADPHTFQYENWSARIPRFAGETSSVTPDMDLSENIRVTKVECGTVFRRLEQGTSPVKSTLRRYVENSVANLIGYWPAEEERFSQQIANAIPGKSPMVVEGPVTTIAGGIGSGTNTVEFAADDTIACSAPLPHTNLSTWTIFLTDFADNSRFDIRFILKVPSPQDPSVWLMELYTRGSANRWHVQLETDGSLSVRAFDRTGIILDDVGNAVIYDTPGLFYLQVAQNGANIDYNLSYIAIGSGALTGYTSGSVAAQTLGRAISLGMISGFDGSLAPDDVVTGHIMIGTSQIASSDFFEPTSAFFGETACARLARLSEENGLQPFGQMDSSDTSAEMGPQQVDTLLNLFVECANTDHGFFGDSRGDNSFFYIPLSKIYDRESSCTLDHDLGHIAEPFTPTDDDATTVNDVTVKARRGSSAHLEQTEGPLNVGDPGTAEGAVGRYDDSAEINPASNEQLTQSAGWLLHLGTTDESRFPEINVNLHDQEMLDDVELSLSILDLDVGDVLSCVNLQTWHIHNDVEQIVLGYTEILDTAYVHTIQFNTAPYSPYNVATLGNGNRLDSSDSTLDEDIDAVDTVFDVTTPDVNTRWIIESDQIVTARATASSGSTTTAVVTAISANDISIGDNLQLYTSVGVLKEATVFTVTDLVDSGSNTTITFSPAAAASVASGNIVRTYGDDNFPFDIVINGERMTVTDINLGSDPQQFVVTRSVNGISKEHLTGSKVELFQPYYLPK